MTNHAGNPKTGIGLAISGGGFRATLFHVGSLWRLNELGILSKLDRLSSVSGGSILNGVLALGWDKLTFNNGVATNFNEIVVDPIRAFCARTIDQWSILQSLIPFVKSVNLLRKAYDKHLFHEKTLSDLPDKPLFIFNAVNTRTGRNFRFTKRYIGDYRTGQIDPAKVEGPGNFISMAVAASSGFPPVFAPLRIKTDPAHWTDWEDGEFKHVFEGEPHHRQHLSLADGGVYDNLGIEPILKSCRTILISNAGAPFSADDIHSVGLFSAVKLRMMKRLIDITMDQVLGLRLRTLVDMYKRDVRDGAYWGIDTDLASYASDTVKPLTVSHVRSGALPSMRTRLNSFSKDEQEDLINWGYALCDAAMRRHGGAGDAQPGAFPYPDSALAKP